jgi:hypothetical protein
LRRDRPPALNEKFEIRRFWQLYIDNFDEGFPKTEGHREGSQPSEWAAALKRAGSSVGIAYSEDEKRVQDQLEAATLGGSIAGRRGLIMATDERLSLLVGITFALMSQPHTRLKDVEVVAGNWIHNIQFNRATMAALDLVWEVIQGKVDAAKRSSLLCPEWMMVLSLLPLMRLDLRTPMDTVVTASDASETGAGVCSASTLTKQGEQGLADAEKARSAPVADELCLFENCGGISGGRRALEILGIKPGLHITTEIDEPAIRVSSTMYPEIINLGNIENVTIESVVKAADLNIHIKHVLCISGWPCQELTGLNVCGKGLEGRSGLINEVLRVEQSVLPKAFKHAKLAFMRENVCSMSAENRAKISQMLQRGCSGTLGHCSQTKGFGLKPETSTWQHPQDPELGVGGARLLPVEGMAMSRSPCWGQSSKPGALFQISSSCTRGSQTFQRWCAASRESARLWHRLAFRHASHMRSRGMWPMVIGTRLTSTRTRLPWKT